MNTLIDLLKIATNRKLSQREIAMAKRGEKYKYPGSMTDSDEFWVDGDCFVKRKTRAVKHYGSREASNPEVVRENPSVIKIDTRWHNQDGSLVKKRVNINSISSPYSSFKVIVYTPSGRFVGNIQAHSESYEKSYRRGE